MSNQTEERFHRMVDAAPSAAILVDRAGKISFVNARMRDLFGYEQDELLGKSIELLVPERFRSKHRKYRDGFFANPQTRPLGAGRELFGVRKDGREVPIEIGLTPIDTPEGVFALAWIIDITERKRAEARFQLVVEAAPSAMVVVDRTGIIRMVNTRAQELFGYQRDELLGFPVELLVPKCLRNGHVGYRESFIAHPTGRPMGAGRDLFGVCKDGREVPIEIGLTPFESPEGMLVLALIVDITERKRAEAAVQQMQSRFRALTENAPDGVALIDRDGSLKFVSPSARKIFGYDPDENPDIKPAEHTHPDDLPIVVSALTQLIENPTQNPTLQYRFRHKDGSWLWIESTFTNLLSVKSVEAIVINFRNITERKQTEEKLRLSDEILQRVKALVLVADSQSQIVYVSPAAKEILDYDPAELLGVKWWDLSRSEAAEREREKEYVGRAARGEIPVSDEPYERVILDRDGKPHTLLWQDAKGPNGLLIGVGHDITERKRAEAELQLQGAALAAAANAIVITDRQSTITWINPAFTQLVGYTAEEAVGQSTRLLQSGFHDEAFYQQMWGTVLSGRVWQGELVHRRKDGSLYYEEQTITPVADEKGAIQHFIAIKQDITRRKQAEEQTQTQLRRLAALRNIDLAILGSLDRNLVFDIVLDEALAQLQADAATILLFNASTLHLEQPVRRGFRTSALEHTRLRIGQGLAGQAALERRQVSIPDLSTVPELLAQSPLLPAEGFVAYHGVPLIAKGQLKGVLEVFYRQPFHPSEDWLDYVAVLAGQAAIAIENAELFATLQRSNTELAIAYDATIEGWSHALDLRDKETEGHTQRVTEMALRLARALGLPETELVHLRRGALLHDIGKMGVPDAILLKPGPLTDDEWVIMKKHPEYALNMLSRIAYLRPALDIPYCHHEKWDGTGYPHGLKGEQIPLAARIFAMVDVWDALRSDRPYRPAWPEAQVCDYLRGASGTHFDPQVVEAFLQLDRLP